MAALSSGGVHINFELRDSSFKLPPRTSSVVKRDSISGTLQPKSFAHVVTRSVPHHLALRLQFTSSSSSSGRKSISSSSSEPTNRVSVWAISATLQMASVQQKKKKPPLKIIISGAPASGKGTQCELIVKKYGLVHISAGDLLRAEIVSGTENGRRAKEYMEKGSLVPDEIVVEIAKERLQHQDAQENGWLLDGYPRSHSQAAALESLGIRPDLFILLDVPESILVERVVGRRLDPVTGKIYHLKYSPPESEEIANRLTQRFDDTEEKVKLRLQTHQNNEMAVISTYNDVIKKVDGNRPKDQVFKEIDEAISEFQKRKSGTRDEAVAASDA